MWERDKERVRARDNRGEPLPFSSRCAAMPLVSPSRLRLHLSEPVGGRHDSFSSDSASPALIN